MVRSVVRRRTVRERTMGMDVSLEVWFPLVGDDIWGGELRFDTDGYILSVGTRIEDQAIAC